MYQSQSYASQQSPAPIQLTIRFTYMLQDWSPASWPQLPPEEYLRNFFVVCQMTNSLDDVLKNMVETEDLSAKAEILDALDRLAQPNALPFRLPQLPQPEVSPESSCNMLLRNQELLIEILGYIFLSSDATPQEKNVLAESPEIESPPEADTNTKLLELKESLNSLKTTHPNSLLWRLALAAAHVYHACGGIEALAQLWVKVIAEMRYYWENNLTLPSLGLMLAEGGPALPDNVLRTGPACLGPVRHVRPRTRFGPA
ncbi:hypothetical protein HPB49_024357 [Dermacentor silvarum]|uniref:Uncharacterized protein n=1 Tax=Dermacentor silvarum TaxID=543639 RepID=A0ACB8E547_DERSI|nr:hypothetical protein HPB49_024357 [Dermacentor silvarum]